jgi:AraC-like DNA-binding protein
LLESILQLYIESGIFVSIFLFLKEFFHSIEKRKISFHLFFVFCILFSQIKISFLLRFSSLPDPWFFLFSISILFLIGPIQYCQTLKLFGKFSFRSVYTHFAFLLISIPIEFIFILVFPEEIPSLDSPKKIFSTISVVAILYYSLYFYFNGVLFQNFLKQYNVDHAHLVNSYNRMVGFFIIFGCLSICFSSKLLYQVDGFLFTTGGFVAILYLMKHPDFFDTISEEVAKQKYERTSLDDLDLDKIKRELESLMTEKKYYQDDEIYLDDIANELMINKNQLSRLLNEIYNKNFYQFINFYRISEAKELIVKFPKRTILDIAYEVGFKSKSAFYKNFVEQTGLTPQEYRLKNKPKP